MVLDARGGEPVAQVQVQVLPAAVRTLSDQKGRFVLPAIPAGEYELHVSTVGYRLLKKAFTLAEGETKDFEVALSQDSLRQTDSIEVTAGPYELARDDSPSQLTLAGTEAKNLASVLADDPLRAVQSLPGVASNDDFDSRFSLRGAGYSRLGLYLDDVLLHSPFHMVAGETATGTVTALNGDALDNLSLHSGAFPVRYGDRTGGALAAETREGTRLGPSLRATASASNAGLLAEGPLGRRGAWLAAARKSYLQYIIRRTASASDPSFAFGILDGQTKLAYDVTGRHHVSLCLSDGYSDLDRTSSAGALGINSLMTSGYHLSLANLGWRYTPGERLLVSSRAAYMRERFTNQNREWLDLEAGHYGEWVWQSQFTWVQTPHSTMEGGLAVRAIRDSGFENRYQFNPAAVQRLEDYGGRGRRSGGYVSQAWSTPGGAFRGVVGARWDRHTANRIQAVSPHASLAVRIAPGAEFRLGWGQYVQYPELRWLFTAAGGRHLLPERSNHLVASIEQRLGQRTRLRAEFYEREDRDLLFRPFYEPRLIRGKIFSPPAGAPVRNSVRGYGRGFEVFLQRRSANSLSGWVSYAYGRARLRDGEAGIAFPADEDQRHTVNAFGNYRVRATVNLSLKWLYGSGYPLPGFYRIQDGRYYLAEDRNRVKVDTFQRVDVRLNKAYVFRRWKLTLYAEAVNVFNRANYRFSSFDGFNARTGRVSLSVTKMFPIIPSAGLVFEFQQRG
ncbi:MAG: TonB-dependent receptor [Bryobacterales bacterium]|nr:TonB-dependent receptor [Bryobacterales bacterium]